MRTYTSTESLLVEPVPSVGETVDIGGRLYLVKKVLSELVDKNIPHRSITFIPVDDSDELSTLRVSCKGKAE